MKGFFAGKGRISILGQILTRFVNSVNIAILYGYIGLQANFQNYFRPLCDPEPGLPSQFGSASADAGGAISAPDAIAAPGFADVCET